MAARARLAFIASAGLCLAATSLVEAGCGGVRPGPRILEVEIQASSGAFATLYWSPDEPRFVPEHSIRVPLSPGSEGLQRLRFPIPGQGVRWVRLDPTDSAGEVSIGRVRVLDARGGQTLGTLDPEAFYPANQIASITRHGDLTRIVPVAGADDPYVFAAFACLDPASVRDRLSRVTTISLTVAAAAAAGLLLASILVIARFAFGRSQAGMSTGDSRHTSRRVAVVWMIVLFFVIFSSKLLLMQKNPVTVPFWDQWDAEARVLYIPFNECRLTWPMMFSLHNEHRVFFTRVLALALLVANGQWDPRLQQLANALIHTLAALLLAAIVWRAYGRTRLDFLVLIGAVAFAVPFSWENTLVGFQSAFYFLILFSILALWLTTTYEALSGPWFLGWSCAVCALFTSAGGVLTPIAIALVLVLKMANDRRWRASFVTLIVAVAVAGVGFALASPPLAHHAALKAKTLADFSGALARDFAWPWIAHPRFSPIMWLPVGLLGTSALLRRARTSDLERFIFGLSGWVALNAAAVAYGRGAGGGMPANRYMDFLSLGFFVNAIALVIAVERIRPATVTRRAAVIALAAWVAFAIAGVDRLNSQTLEDLAVWHNFWVVHASNVRRFVGTGDASELVGKRPLLELPYPDAQTLIVTLRHPYIRRILPAAAREPIPLDRPTVTNNAFIPDGSPRHEHDSMVRTWGSYAAQGRNDEGWFESQPVGPCQVGSRLAFQVTGYLGMPHQYLATRELTSGREVPVRPSAIPGEHWVSAVVSCPEGPFVIKAIDGTRDSWFAFREPTEVGWGSLAAEWGIARSRDFLLAALALGIVALRWT